MRSKTFIPAPVCSDTLHVVCSYTATTQNDKHVEIAVRIKSPAGRFASNTWIEKRTWFRFRLVSGAEIPSEMFVSQLIIICGFV